MVARCTKGLPVGARFVRSFYDEQHDIVVFVFEHPSFPEVPEGNIVPFMDVEYSRLAHLSRELEGFPTEADG